MAIEFHLLIGISSDGKDLIYIGLESEVQSQQDRLKAIAIKKFYLKSLSRVGHMV